MLKVFVGDRQSGKSTKLLEWAADPSTEELRFILVATKFESVNLSYMAQDLWPWNAVSSRIIMPEELYRIRKFENVVIGIDNLDLLIQKLLKTVSLVEYITITGEPVNGS